MFLFSILGMGAGSSVLEILARKVKKLRKFEEYEKCNTYFQTFINLFELFWLFGKHSDLVLGLNTLRKCSVFKASFKKFQSLFSKISKFGIFSHQFLFCIGKWGRIWAPNRSQKNHWYSHHYLIYSLITKWCITFYREKRSATANYL